MQPELEAAYQNSAQHALAAGPHLEQTVLAAALDEAREVIADELVPAIEKVLAVESRLQGLRAALMEMANRGSSPIVAASGTAVAIGELLSAAKREAGVSRDDAGGRAFLERLAADPEARL